MINLMYSGNYKMFDGMIISLLSITKHTKRPLNVYILTGDYKDLNPKFVGFDDNQIKCLDDIVKKANPQSQVVKIDLSNYKDMFASSANAHTKYSVYSMMRLLADKLNLPDKILYLDTDVVAYNDISQLWDMDIEDFELAIVKDYYGKVFLGPKYFNSGVMLINLKKVKETKLFEKAMQMCMDKKMLLPDQSALNKFAKHKKYLPTRFNSQKKLYEDTVLRHFSMIIKFLPKFHTVNIKPWNIDLLHEKYKCYEFDDILGEYQTILKNYKKEYNYE